MKLIAESPTLAKIQTANKKKQRVPTGLWVPGHFWHYRFSNAFTTLCGAAINNNKETQ